jgi:hypothetical protein
MAHSVSSSSSSSPGSASRRSASSKSNARLGVLAVPRFGLRPDGGAVRQLHLTGEPVLHPGSKPLAFGELRDLRPTRPRLGMPLRDRRLVVEPPCSRRRVPTQLTRDRRRRPGERGERSRGRRDSALGAARCPRVRRTTGIGRSRGAGRRQRRGQAPPDASTGTVSLPCAAMSLLARSQLRATRFASGRSRRTGNRSADRRPMKTDGDEDPYRPLAGRYMRRPPIPKSPDTLRSIVVWVTARSLRSATSMV